MKEIRLLNKNLRKEYLYEIFLNEINFDDEKLISKDDPIKIKDIRNFPFYLGKYDSVENKTKDELRKEDFFEMIETIETYFLELGREVLMDKRFWYSYLILYMRSYILEKYPQTKESQKFFNNIVVKKFDWENYIYKIVLLTQYVNDKVHEKEKRYKYYELAFNNFDIFNYILKYDIFRNDNFLLYVLEIIDEENLGKELKERIKGVEKDKRYGREIIYELNKIYPVVLIPMLEKQELKEYFLRYYKKYKGQNLLEYLKEKLSL